MKIFNIQGSIQPTFWIPLFYPIVVVSLFIIIAIITTNHNNCIRIDIFVSVSNFLPQMNHFYLAYVGLIKYIRIWESSYFRVYINKKRPLLSVALAYYSQACIFFLNTISIILCFVHKLYYPLFAQIIPAELK